MEFSRNRLAAWIHSQRWLGGITFSLFLFVVPAFSQNPLFDPSFRRPTANRVVDSGPGPVVHALLAQSSGDILVGGDFKSLAGGTNAYLGRLKSNGQIDTSFGTGTDGTIHRLLEQADGKVLVTGEFTKLQGIARKSLGRLLPDGRVDMSFDCGTNIAPGETIFGICVQQDGRIVTATTSTNAYAIYRPPVFSRFRPDGQLDESFSRTNTPWFRVFSMLALTNETILVGGDIDSTSGSPGLVALTENGHISTNLSKLFNGPGGVTSLAPMLNGNILVGGYLDLPGQTNIGAVAQLTPSFQWNTSFVADRFNRYESGATVSGFVSSVLEDPDGKILAGGLFDEVGGFFRQSVVRLDSQGRVDPCFDPGIGFFPSSEPWTLSTVRQPDGRILVGGGSSSSVVARLLPQGECGALRVYRWYQTPGSFPHYIYATCPPGGTNLLQVSTNLIDWQTVFSKTRPILIRDIWTSPPTSFFRVKKVF